MSDKNFVFVSDLHLSEGFLSDENRYQVNEDFFFDDAFGGFLRHLQEKREAEGYAYPWRLVVVGDFLENLQITTSPVKNELVTFLKNAQSIIYPEEKGRPDFDSIRFSPNEKHYGLGFDGPKSVWKLARIIDGHHDFFVALAEFLAAGNELVIVKGNHDPEFTYPELRRYLVDRLNRLAQQNHPGENVAGRIFFSPWFYYEPGLFYTEHGGQYDDANRYPFFLKPTMFYKKTGALTIRFPLFGSSFVRYFFNEIENRIPFADNVRPQKKALSWIMKNKPAFALMKIPRGFWFFYNYLKKKLTSGFDCLAALEANKSERGILRRVLWLVMQPLKLGITASKRLEYCLTKAGNFLFIQGLAGTNGILGEADAELVDPEIPAETLHRIYYRAFKIDKKTESRAAETTTLLEGLKTVVDTPPEELERNDIEVIERVIGLIRSGTKAKPILIGKLLKWLDFIVTALLATGYVVWLSREGFTWPSLAVFAVIALFVFWLFRDIKKELVRGFLDAEPERYLNKAAAGVARLLGPDRVRFVIFGHTHVAYARPIKEDQGTGDGGPKEDKAPRPSQWEINTGSWTPVFDERMMLRQNGDEFPFIQIVTEKAGAEPDFELYRWNDELGRPQRIRFVGDV